MALAEYNLETPDSDAALAALPARVGRAPQAERPANDVLKTLPGLGGSPMSDAESARRMALWGSRGRAPQLSDAPPSNPEIKPAAPSARPPVANILPRGDITKAIVERAAARGMPMPQHVAEGITDRIFAESGGNPMAYNPNDVNGPSGGLYQAHNERLTALQKYAAAQGKAWTDPHLQIDQMLNEYAGADQIAARHRAEVWGAPTREAAAAAHDRYFERSAGGIGGGTGDAEFSRMQQEGRAGISDLSGKIDRLMVEAGKAAPGSEERRKLMDRLLTHSDELSAKFEKLSDHPPKSQSPFEAMSEWAPLMLGLVALAGMKTARPAYGALNAAGAALGALKQGNDEGYKNAMEVWSKQTEMAHKAYQMQNEELRVIMEDERLSESERHNKFEEALRAFGMERDLQLMKQGLSKDAYDNVFKRQDALDKHEAAIDRHKLTESEVVKNLRGSPTEQKEQEVQRAVKADDDKWLAEHPEAKGVVPPEVHFEHYTKRGAETTRAAGSPQGIAIHKFLEENPNATAAEIQAFIERARPARSGAAAAVRKFMEENPNATADDIKKFVASQAAETSAARSFATGRQGDAIRAFSVSVSHLATLEELGAALKNGDVQSLNRVKNALQTEFGYSGPVNFEAAKDIVGAEVNKAIIGGVGSLTDREEVRHTLSAANSPEQLLGVVSTLKKLIAGQLDGYRRQYKNATGGSDEDFNKLLSPEAQREVGTLGEGTAPSFEHVKAAIAAGAPRDAARKRFIELGGDGAAFDREVPP